MRQAGRLPMARPAGRIDSKAFRSALGLASAWIPGVGERVSRKLCSYFGGEGFQVDRSRMFGAVVKPFFPGRKDLEPKVDVVLKPLSRCGRGEIPSQSREDPRSLGLTTNTVSLRSTGATAWTSGFWERPKLVKSSSESALQHRAGVRGG
ncbi:hypothetical protein Q5P01_000097 [Channa striata]|uniref:Uncharacterized protein n=1 Tax=Channa striata TaxID=64152 RepID=A0AA88IJ93_CHASR|nr:hypothetical protein Q5P01_000097 [Channa striata]